MDSLFFLVWRNTYLIDQLYKQLQIINDSSFVKFKSLKELKEYKYRDYIESLWYESGEQIGKNDLPNSGYLKKIYFTKLYQSFQGDYFPEGVESIYFCFANKQPLDMFCYKLPKSVTCVGYLNLKSSNGLNVKSLLETTNIKEIVLNDDSVQNQKLQNDLFPTSVRSLVFSEVWDNLDSPLKKGDIPEGVESLHMPCYTQEIGLDILPSTLTTLTTSHPSPDYKLLAGSFPNSIKHLKLYSDKSLYSDDSDRLVIDINTIPNSTTHLKLCTYQVDIRPHSLPDSLKILKFKSTVKDNVILENILPPFLESLSFSRPVFINSTLPITLTSLSYNITNKEPLSNIEFLSNLKSLTHLKLKNVNTLGVGFIPTNNTLRQLSLGFHFTSQFDLVPGILPNGNCNLNLKITGYKKKFKQGAFPISVTSLSFGSGYDLPFDENVLPINLLKFENQTLNQNFKPNIIPQSCTELNLYSFNQPLEIGSLSNNLKTLKLDSYNHPLDKVGILPNGLSFLKLIKYNHKITIPNIIPSTLKTLVLNQNIKKEDKLYSLFSNDALPTSLLKFNNIKYV